MTPTHAPDCGGDGAPWCSPACVRAVDLEAVALAVGLSERTVRRYCKPTRFDNHGRALYDPYAVADALAEVTPRRRGKAA